MQVAMGELGWSPSEAYWCDVNAIHLAAQGQVDLLCRVGLLQRENVSTPDRPPRDIHGRPISFEQMFERRIAADAASGTSAAKRRRSSRRQPPPTTPSKSQ